MKIPAAAEFTFAWSLRRERCLAACPRGYFLRYYAARGGHERGMTDHRTEQLFLLRSLLSRGAYLQYVINLAMRELFYAPEEFPGTALGAMAAGILRTQFARVLTYGLENGGHGALPAELAETRTRPETLQRELARQLAERCAQLESGGWVEVNAVPRERRRKLDFPLTVHVGELPCHTPMLLAWRHEGTCHFVEGTYGVPAGEAAELTALLHRYCAMEMPGGDAGRVRSLAFDAGGRLTEFGAQLEPGRALRRLRRGAGRLAVFRSGDGTWREEAFPPRPESCGSCALRPACEAEKYAPGY